MGDGELRYLALSLVLLTGPGVLEVDPVGEVPAAMQALSVVVDGFDRGLDAVQRGSWWGLLRGCVSGGIFGWWGL